MYALSGLYKIRIWTETALAAQLPSNTDKHRIPSSTFVSLGIRTLGYKPYFIISMREKTKMEITLLHLSGYLSEIRF